MKSPKILDRSFEYVLIAQTKQASETQYWLRLLDQGKVVKCDLSFFMEEIVNIINITTAIVKTTQNNLK